MAHHYLLISRTTPPRHFLLSKCSLMKRIASSLILTNQIFKICGIIRNMALRPVTKIIVLADEATFAIFKPFAGRTCNFSIKTPALISYYRPSHVSRKTKQQSIKELHTKITANEFNVMMMLARGWSLTQIAGASQKVKNHRGVQKQYCQKTRQNNTRLKYTISHYCQP